MLHLEVPLCTQLWRRQSFHHSEVSSSQKQRLMSKQGWSGRLQTTARKRDLGQKRGSYSCGQLQLALILVMRNGVGVGYPHAHCSLHFHLCEGAGAPAEVESWERWRLLEIRMARAKMAWGYKVTWVDPWGHLQHQGSIPQSSTFLEKLNVISLYDITLLVPLTMFMGNDYNCKHVLQFLFTVNAKRKTGARETVQWLRAHTALKDLNTHTGWHTTPSLDSVDTIYAYAHTHTKIHMHTHTQKTLKIKKFILKSCLTIFWIYIMTLMGSL